MRTLEIYLTIKCRLSEKDFEIPFDELPESLQREFIEYHADCGSTMGVWCEGCHFCMGFEEDDET